MNINERVEAALAGNEVLTEDERMELVNLMKGLQFIQKFEGIELTSEAASRLTAIIGFLQQSNRIEEDEEEELQMIVNEIEAGREE